jgi:hypothetical protein
MKRAAIIIGAALLPLAFFGAVWAISALTGISPKVVTPFLASSAIMAGVAWVMLILSDKDSEE